MSFSETFQFPVFLMSSLLTICLYTTYIVYPHLFVAFTGFITFKARYHKGDVCLLKKKKSHSLTGPPLMKMRHF